jgi:hypothetical protein
MNIDVQQNDNRVQQDNDRGSTTTSFVSCRAAPIWLILRRSCSTPSTRSCELATVARRFDLTKPTNRIPCPAVDHRRWGQFLSRKGLPRPAAHACRAVTWGTVAYLEMDDDAGTRSRSRLTSGGLQMRKLILITLIALMSSSSCYANLSLASNEAPQTLAEQPKPQTTQVRPDATIKYPTAIKHSTTIKHPTISRPRRVDPWGQNLRTQGSYEHSYEHCF